MPIGDLGVRETASEESIQSVCHCTANMNQRLSGYTEFFECSSVTEGKKEMPMRD